MTTCYCRPNKLDSRSMTSQFQIQISIDSRSKLDPKKLDVDLYTKFGNISCNTMELITYHGNTK